MNIAGEDDDVELDVAIEFERLEIEVQILKNQQLHRHISRVGSETAPALRAEQRR